MNKRIIFSLLAAVILVMSLSPAAYAAESVASGTCGDGITWTYANHTLTITGSGDMDDGAPWEEYKDKIETVVFTGGVTKVGAKAFENYDRLETVDFGDSMREIGKRAFYDCNDIVEIRLPDTFRTFGEECFRNCISLKRVICEGGIMPSFKSACLHTGNYISVFYPPNSPWSSEYYQPVMTAYGGLLGFFMASEEIMEYGYVEETEAATEAEEEETEATEAAVAVIAEEVEETVPETTAATVPATEPETEPTETTVPETTVPETTEPETTAPETQETEADETEFTLTEATEPAEEESASSKGWIGLVMIAGVLTFLIAGAMIFRSASRRRY